MISIGTDSEAGVEDIRFAGLRLSFSSPTSGCIKYQPTAAVNMAVIVRKIFSFRIESSFAALFNKAVVNINELVAKINAFQKIRNT